MPHLHTGHGDHDATVSFVIVRTDGPKPRLSYHLHRKAQKLMTFGGHIERDETPWGAVLRELVEESGYLPEQVRVLQPAVRLHHLTNGAAHPQPVLSSTGCTQLNPAHFHTDLLYALVTGEEPAGAPADGESTDIRLLTRSELDVIPDEHIVEMWREAGRFILDEMLPAWTPVELGEYLAVAPRRV